MPRLFISYPRLDEWVAEEKVRLTGDRLVWTDGRSFRLAAAVHFLAVVTGDSDPHGLLGKVKTGLQLAEIGAEHMQDSVLLGETGYQVVEGFIGEPV